MAPRPTLIVFARAPAIGVGKTRLARDLGRVEAWRIYRALSARTLWRLRDPRWDLLVALTPARAGAAAGWPRGVRVVGQGRGDLGARLERVLRHGRGPAVVVGTDAPDVTRALVWAGLQACRRRGAAFGPAEDGGFWLMALSAERARRLELGGVRWSGPHALRDTEAKVGPAVRLPFLLDIDDGADWRRWNSRRRQRSKAAATWTVPDATASRV